MNNFKISHDLILKPAGISHDNLSTIMDKIHNKNIDYADLYFQYSKNEFWSLEDGQVKNGSFSIDHSTEQILYFQGVLLSLLLLLLSYVNYTEYMVF